MGPKSVIMSIIIQIHSSAAVLFHLIITLLN